MKAVLITLISGGSAVIVLDAQHTGPRIDSALS